MPFAFCLHRVAMSQASETESEFSCEGLTSFSEPSLPGGNSRRNLLGTITHEQVLRAIHDIDATGAQFSSSDEAASRRALEQWKTLHAFIESTLASLSASAEPRLNDNQLFVTGLLIRDVFLSKLFRLREALDNRDPKPDSFLSILHSILRHVLTLSGILCTDTCGDADSFVPKGLRQIRERDLHNSISNLPRGWHSIPSILSGKTYSPATQRCALTLLFVAYVVGPQLGNDPPSESSHKVVLDHLYQCIDDSLNSHSFLLTTGNPEQSQLTLAMFVCLFSTVHIAVFRDTSSDNGGSPMRPRSFGFLLEVMITVLGHPSNEAILPLQSITPAQHLCLRWGKVVPWTWSVWQDRRAANSEAVVFLTSTWFYHRDAPLKIVDHPTTSLQMALKQHRSASAITIQRTWKSTGEPYSRFLTGVSHPSSISFSMKR
ncbi:hypothetical protein FA13DRAFT_458727 [Coprinellus micaceus]|uniref:Uncharacterized protein n=1 Tax=Coprinellus micaceus TaxID=71717 RepID=A0A4Y7TZ04_COPMI|nr:hypothetical protein FA13DRAFT_458727 [Coprinellus micaceus]